MSSDPKTILDDMLSRRHRTFIATGDTYPHREEFTSWGWHWDASRRAWVEDNGSEPDELCIEAIRRLPGVTVTEEADNAGAIRPGR